MFKRISAFIMALVGIVVVILGINLTKNLEQNHYILPETFKFNAEDYDLPYCAFGGDFYTEIYKASDYIVDVLDDINKANETIVKAESSIFNAARTNIEAVDELNNNVSKTDGMIVIALGLWIFTSGLNAIAAEFNTQKQPVIEAASENNDIG